MKTLSLDPGITTFTDQLLTHESCCPQLRRLLTQKKDGTVEQATSRTWEGCCLKNAAQRPFEELSEPKMHMLEVFQNNPNLKIPVNVERVVEQALHSLDTEEAAHLVYQTWWQAPLFQLQNAKTFDTNDLNTFTFWDCVSRNLIFRPEEKIPGTVEEIAAWYACQENQQRLAEITQLEYKPRWTNEFKLTEIPPEIKYFVGLTELDFSNNAIDRIPSELGVLTKLEVLKLANNNISEIPCTVDLLAHLKHLDMSHNALVKIDPAIGKLVQLAYVNLSANQLREVPQEMGKLINLRELYLAQNKLAAYPAEVRQIKTLQALDIAEHPLSRPF